MGCKVFRSNVGLFYTQDFRLIRIGTPGFSDLHGHTPDGRAFYIETKTLTGRASEQQTIFLEQMRKSENQEYNDEHLVFKPEGRRYTNRVNVNDELKIELNNYAQHSIYNEAKLLLEKKDK